MVKLHTKTGILLLLVCFMAMNLIVQYKMPPWRLDGTEGKIHTLSLGTREILSQLKEPITLRFYFSGKLAVGSPALQAYAGRVRDMLQEYQQASNGLVQVQYTDPEPFSEAEDDAMRYGLSGLPVDLGGGNIYFGLLAFGSADQQALIPLFQEEREPFLEYDLTKLIQDVSAMQKPVLGLLSAIPFGNAGTQYSNGQEAALSAQMFDLLDNTFLIRTLDPGAMDWQDSDLSAVLVVRPERLPVSALFALDQYVLRGGHALVLTDPFYEPEGFKQGEDSAAGSGQSLDAARRLFASWGLILPEKTVVADLEAAKKVWFTPHERPEVIDYPLWLELGTRHVDANDPITSRMTPIVLSTAGVLERMAGYAAPTDYQFTPLMQTGSDAMLLPVETVGAYTMDPYKLLQDYQPSGNKAILAARIQGTFHSAFDKGISGFSVPSNAIQTGQKPAHLVILADADCLQDKFWVRTQSFLGQVFATPVAANGNIVINAIDNLSGRSALIGIRAQQAFSRPFLRFKAMQQRAEREFRAKEKELQEELAQTEDKLRDLEKHTADASASFWQDTQQRAELERFRQQKIAIRGQLRAIQHDLRQDILQLENRIRWLNVYVFPLLVGLVGALFLFSRRRAFAARQYSRVVDKS